MKKKVRMGSTFEAVPQIDKGLYCLSSVVAGGLDTDGEFSERAEDLEHHNSGNLTIRLKIPKGITESECSAKEAVDEDDYGKQFVKSHSGSLSCQVHGCTADLSMTNDYFRRNRICHSHFKAFKVMVDCFEQRFCHQCNKFHLLAEFDENKRNCRMTLASQDCRRKRTEPEATPILPSKPLANITGNLRQCEIEAGQADSVTCEDLERTVTNEETSDTDKNLRDDASSGDVWQENSFHFPYINRGREATCMDLLSLARMKQDHLWKTHLSSVASKSTARKSNECKRRNVSSGTSNTNICQVEGCMVDLTDTKDYFRRRKVCEQHFRASKVKVNNVDQRFCQQCSRFHVLSEFDEGRKSCKKMLLGHNMRRRKSHPEAISRMKGQELNDLTVSQHHPQKQNSEVNLIS